MPRASLQALTLNSPSHCGFSTKPTRQCVAQKAVQRYDFLPKPTKIQSIFCQQYG